jgi:hypothetical protein
MAEKDKQQQQVSAGSAGQASQETFENRMASLMPGSIVFCGHRKTNLSTLMRRYVDYMLDRPQSAESAEELSVEIFVPAPDPVWTSIMDGRPDGTDARIELHVGTLDHNVCDVSPKLNARLNSGKRPKDHMIVVFDHAPSNYTANYTWQHILRYASDYNMSVLVRSNTAPEMGTAEYNDVKRIDDIATVAVIAYDPCPDAKDKIYEVFGTSFGSKDKEEKEKMSFMEIYHKFTYTTETEKSESFGTHAMIIEYRGTGNVAYDCGIPRSIVVGGRAKRD